MFCENSVVFRQARSALHIIGDFHFLMSIICICLVYNICIFKWRYPLKNLSQIFKQHTFFGSFQCFFCLGSYNFRTMTVSVLYFRELETVIRVQLRCHLRLFYTTVPCEFLTCGNLNCVYTKSVQQAKLNIFQMESRHMNK